MSVKLNRNLIHGFKYSSEYIYSKNDIVIESTDDDVLMYKSLIDNNLDSDIHDPTKWECTSIASTHLALFVPMWSDHILNDPAWLRADNYSWHDSRIYESAYEILEKENSGRTNNNLSTYVYSGISVTYYQSPNGYKIAYPDQEEKIENIYRQMGVAWFYILDTEKKRFKLPRTEHGFVGVKDNDDGTLNVVVPLESAEMYLYFCVGGVAKNPHVVNVGEVMEIINNFNLTLFDEKVTEIKDKCVDELDGKTNEGLESLSQATIDSYNLVSNQANKILESFQTNIDSQIGLIADEGDKQIQRIIDQTNSSTEELESIIDEARDLVDSIDFSNLVNLTDDQTIDGVKTFNQTPKITSTIQSDDNSNNAVTSKWVNDFFNNQKVINSITETSGNISLEENKLYTMSINGNTSFILPTPSNLNIFNQIKVMIKVTGTPTIDWGVNYFFNKEAPTIEESSYDVYFDYDNLLAGWVCGCISKGK